MNVADYHPDQRELMIIDGKGRKDRVVPVGEYACLFVDAYLKMIRLWLVGSPEEKALFVDSMNGGRLSLQTVAYIVKKAVKRSGVGKDGKRLPRILSGIRWLPIFFGIRRTYGISKLS